MGQTSPSKLLTEQEYRQRVLDLSPPLNRTVLSAITNTYGGIIAENLASRVDLPGFRNSAMDGYAVRAADAQQVPVTLPVMGDVPAGAAGDIELKPGTAMRIMTGAPIPAGADAVIRVEWTDGGTDQVTLSKPVVPGSEIREAGEDLRTGDSIATVGDVVTPGMTGLLAAAGYDQFLVCEPPRVAVFATGDELHPIGDRYPVASNLPPGGIFDSNSHQGAAQVVRAGGVVSTRQTLTDDIDRAIDELQTVAETSDLIVTSGGVSAGAYEVVKDVFDRLGGGVFTGVDIQPGKPQGHGMINNTPVICLPGNPLSAFVSFELFVRPVIRKLGGHNVWDNPEVTATTTADLKRAAYRTRYLPAILDWATMTVSTPAVHGSHRVSTGSVANCLIKVPGQHLDVPGSDSASVVEAGSAVQVVLLDRLT